MKTVKKQDLPTKICLVCQRPFSWRRKWARDWYQVLYCSERCKSNKQQKNDTIQDKL